MTSARKAPNPQFAAVDASVSAVKGVRSEVGDSRSDSNDTAQRLAWAHRHRRPSKVVTSHQVAALD